MAGHDSRVKLAIKLPARNDRAFGPIKAQTSPAYHEILKLGIQGGVT
jgi:hypothetical protein